jgi:hypothetical protein
MVTALARAEGSGGSSAALSSIEPDSGHAYKSCLNAFPGMNLIVLLASILTCARVLDLTPIRAFRTAILNVPNPSNLALLVSLTPCLTASIAAATIHLLRCTSVPLKVSSDDFNKSCR